MPPNFRVFGLFSYLLIFGLEGQTKSSTSGFLGLETFLDQVRAGNLEYQAFERASDGAKLRSLEARFVTGPQLFGDSTYSEDKTEGTLPSLPGDTRATEVTLGVAEQFSFGLGAKLSYKMGRYDLREANPAALPPSGRTTFYRSRPQLELSFPLYKNFLGSETRAQRQALLNQAKAKEHVESFRAKVLLAEAESLYWKLSLSRALVKAAEENLVRAKKMKAWSERRKKLGLADESQFLQADANFELRDLEYSSAVDEERASRRKFNTLRGKDDDFVPEVLDDPSSAMVSSLPVPKEFSEREDLRALRSELAAKKAAARISKEKFRPALDLVGQYAWNGKDNDRTEAESESFSNKRRSYAVGIKFSLPLELGTLRKQQRGYHLEEKAYELQLQREEYEGVRAWHDLREKFLEGRERFKALLKIEAAQKKKLLRERDLQSRGRSTLFQVLQFESDYSASLIARSRAQVELLSLYAQLKTYPAVAKLNEKSKMTETPSP